MEPEVKSGRCTHFAQIVEVGFDAGELCFAQGDPELRDGLRAIIGVDD